MKPFLAYDYNLEWVDRPISVNTEQAAPEKMFAVHLVAFYFTKLKEDQVKKVRFDCVRLLRWPVWTEKSEELFFSKCQQMLCQPLEECALPKDGHKVSFVWMAEMHGHSCLW